jgi:hypothetical protein
MIFRAIVMPTPRRAPGLMAGFPEADADENEIKITLYQEVINISDNSRHIRMTCPMIFPGDAPVRPPGPRPHARLSGDGRGRPTGAKIFRYQSFPQISRIIVTSG